MNKIEGQGGYEAASDNASPNVLAFSARHGETRERVNDKTLARCISRAPFELYGGNQCITGGTVKAETAKLP
ncbi:MAG TPA: hypothetical protein VNE63_14320, partial [Candidatus Acidoferrales bacterium]|nr:hypothetical protein [Candidatus Acidoferrales bacterium]